MNGSLQDAVCTSRKKMHSKGSYRTDQNQWHEHKQAFIQDFFLGGRGEKIAYMTFDLSEYLIFSINLWEFWEGKLAVGGGGYPRVPPSV